VPVGQQWADHQNLNNNPRCSSTTYNNVCSIELSACNIPRREKEKALAGFGIRARYLLVRQSKTVRHQSLVRSKQIRCNKMEKKNKRGFQLSDYYIHDWKCLLLFSLESAKVNRDDFQHPCWPIPIHTATGKHSICPVSVHLMVKWQKAIIRPSMSLNKSELVIRWWVNTFRLPHTCLKTLAQTSWTRFRLSADIDKFGEPGLH
jgi:hypothetical protein